MKFLSRKIIRGVIYSFALFIILSYNNFTIIDNHQTVMVSNNQVGMNDEIKDEFFIPVLYDKDKESNLINKMQNQGESQKVAFLTFDDGPCVNNTLKILDILNKNNIKATFFVVGKKVEQYPDILKRLNDSNMCIAPHTYSHEYKIYKNREAYLDDLKCCTDAIKRVTNKEVISYTRLPGGSFNSVSNRMQMRDIREAIKSRNLKYVDWNVTSGDAIKDGVPTYKIKQNVIKQCSNRTIAVILFHDAYYKKTTVEALPDIIKNLKESGFVFKTFNNITPMEEEILTKERVINR